MCVRDTEREREFLVRGILAIFLHRNSLACTKPIVNVLCCWEFVCQSFLKNGVFV